MWVEATKTSRIINFSFRILFWDLSFCLQLRLLLALFFYSKDKKPSINIMEGTLIGYNYLGRMVKEVCISTRGILKAWITHYRSRPNMCSSLLMGGIFYIVWCSFRRLGRDEVFFCFFFFFLFWFGWFNYCLLCLLARILCLLKTGLWNISWDGSWNNITSI